MNEGEDAPYPVAVTLPNKLCPSSPFLRQSRDIIWLKALESHENGNTTVRSTERRPVPVDVANRDNTCGTLNAVVATACSVGSGLRNRRGRNLSVRCTV
jgi:hypothetical protein